MARRSSLNRRWFLKTTGGAVLAAPFIGRAHAQGPIKIGAQGVSSGSHADYGRQIQMGARHAAEEINSKGGIMGRQVEIIYRDDELNNEVALKNARYFKSQGVNFMVGTDSSGVCLALGPVLPELDLIQIFTHAATEKLTEELVFKNGIKHIFRGSVPVYQDAILPALVFKDNMDIKRIANLGADYEYGRTSWAMFTTTLKKFRPDIEIVGEAWAPFFTADFTPHLSALAARKPDLIFATPWAGEAVLMLRQATTLGVFKDKLWATARYIWNWPDSTENKAFVSSFSERWGRLPNYSAECTYSAILTL